MFEKIYERNSYIVFKVKNGFVVYNTKKKFEDGHTHMKSYNACKSLIDLSSNNKIPRSKSFYFLTSLARVSNDEKYTDSIIKLIETKKHKGKVNYRNKNNNNLR